MTLEDRNVTIKYLPEKNANMNDYSMEAMRFSKVLCMGQRASYRSRFLPSASVESRFARGGVYNKALPRPSSRPMFGYLVKIERHHRLLAKPFTDDLLLYLCIMKDPAWAKYFIALAPDAARRWLNYLPERASGTLKKSGPFPQLPSSLRSSWFLAQLRPQGVGELGRNATVGLKCTRPTCHLS